MKLDIRKIRKEAGLNQTELARKAGVSIEMISGLETGRRTNAKITTLEKIAAALGYDVAVSFIRR